MITQKMQESGVKVGSCRTCVLYQKYFVCIIRNLCVEIYVCLFSAVCEEGSAKLFQYEEDYVPLNEDELPSYLFIKDELSRGTVGVCYNGTYDTVCGEVWGNMEASVVCQQLGFSQYGESIHYNA